MYRVLFVNWFDEGLGVALSRMGYAVSFLEPSGGSLDLGGFDVVYVGKLLGLGIKDVNTFGVPVVYGIHDIPSLFRPNGPSHVMSMASS
ncbi:hypothetical protein [Thermoproteus tenax]|uniref:Uncharacterized protein n=1 Tax=Thermoproteus tenax (strain ATCC 35583 / DSM 2078 / JCM 9277 / NBRC 100435 / Kra 1) TaxID=768679 RepID=G4RK84_THETK|nr:hypothetical protein [Thermoproteus tenax]CCC81979.1 hypothetical protein TTX_1342 [Thermoproteus tenax Kra 1]